MAAPRRNIELKASDPDPERSLAVVLGLGARDRGSCASATRTSASTRGRLKLREEEPGGATLVQYDRVDADEARESRYRLVPVDDPRGAVRRAARPASARSRWSRRSATCCCGRACASTSTASRTSATSSSSRASRPRTPTSPTSSTASPASPRRSRSRPSASCATPTRDQVVGSGALVDAARAVMERAHAPYSSFRVGAALRAEDGSIHVGANVENAAYPQGQCAEASAIGAMIASGRRRITEVAVISDGDAPCVPCGGCRQRLREFIVPGAEIHMVGGAGQTVHVDARGAAPALLRPGVPARVSALEGFAPRLGIVLGSGLGGIADALDRRHRDPVQRSSRASRSRASPATAGRCSSATSAGCRSRSSRAASTSTRPATRPACASRSARSSSSAPRRCSSPTPPAR